MGLITETQNEYYSGNNHGSYQFISLQDLITQFEIAYVGEGKVIPKIKRADISFFAQRALQELSFDTFKSIKSQEIEVPPSLQMILPHDYVSYTKLSSVDASGIKHVLYPTKDTNNPFQIKQNADGSYFFGEATNIVNNFDFTVDLNASEWSFNNITFGNGAWDSTSFNANGNGGNGQYKFNYILDSIQITNQELEFSILWHNNAQNTGGSKAYGAWQRLDVSNADIVTLKATAKSGDRQTDDSGTLLCDYGVVRVGLSTINPSVGFELANGNIVNANHTNPYNTNYPSPNVDASRLNLGYTEWSDGTASQKELEDIDVSSYDEVWVYIQSFSPWQAAAVTDVSSGAQGGTVAISPTSSVNNTPQKNTVNEVQIVVDGLFPSLTENNEDGISSTWDKYKSITPAEDRNDNYDDDDHIYQANVGRRYGIEPSHAQINGSFYIDELRGKIHFSSNISGETVILDYISDSLGTDEEMQVHKFAEEAMYKHIAYAILSTSSNPLHQNLAGRIKRERFAATRQAKLRLSNIKLEELTQILRGKSKHIKH
jgi:hypothetical protein